MTRTKPLFAWLCVAALLAACEQQPDSYPLSGEPCGPEDPVQEITVPSCAPIGTQ